MAKIGIFDSGVGGFSILKEVQKRLPDHEYYYFADHAFSPYGDKRHDQLIQRMCSISTELEAHSIKTIIVACNTATLAGIDEVRKKFPRIKFIGVEPYINAIHKEAKRLPLSRPALLLTPSSFKSQKFRALKKRIENSKRVRLFVLPKLASLVERAYWDGMNKQLKSEIYEELKELKAYQPSHVILGCTHYSLVKNMISKYAGAPCITPCKAVAKRTKYILSQNAEKIPTMVSHDFLYKSSTHNQWELKSFEDLQIQ